MNPNLKLRPETSADQAAIFSVNAAAFPTDAEARLVDALRDAAHLTLSWVAELDGQIVAHVAFSPVTISSDPEAASGLGLGPVAVNPDFQGQGIGSQLILTALAACSQAGFTWVVVLGAPAYYQRFGFTCASEFGLRNSFGVDDEFMAQALQPGGLPVTPGLVAYAPEFSLVD